MCFIFFFFFFPPPFSLSWSASRRERRVCEIGHAGTRAESPLFIREANLVLACSSDGEGGSLGLLGYLTLSKFSKFSMGTELSLRDSGARRMDCYCIGLSSDFFFFLVLFSILNIATYAQLPLYEDCSAQVKKKKEKTSHLPTYSLN